MAILVTCTCGKQFKVKDELAGKRGKCVACGKVLTVPALASAAEAEPTPRKTCPTCNEALQPNLVICLGCGLDLRTGKKLLKVKSTSPVAPAIESPPARASSTRLWMAVAAGGAFVAVGICVASVVAVFYISKSSVPGPSDNPPALKKLLAKVSTISPDDVERYEKYLREPTFVNATFYLGAMPHSGADVREAIKLGLEKPAVAALMKLAQEKKNSTAKADLLICSQSVNALGQFGVHAKEAIPLLAELQNHKERAVESAAKLALKNIAKGSPLPDSGALPAADWGVQTAKRLEGRRFKNVDVLKRASAKLSPGTAKEWKDALEQVTEQKVQGLIMLDIILRFSPIWKGDEFLTAESQRYIGRIKQLPRDQFNHWHNCFGIASAEPVEKLATVLTLIQMDYLYDADQFRVARAAQLLPRLKSLNRELLQPWAEALKCDRLEAAIEMIDQDWLFENDRLKASAAEDALQALRAANPKSK